MILLFTSFMCIMCQLRTFLMKYEMMILRGYESISRRLQITLMLYILTIWLQCHINHRIIFLMSIGNTKSKHNDLNGHVRLVNLTLNSVPVSIWVNNISMVDLYITKHLILIIISRKGRNVHIYIINLENWVSSQHASLKEELLPYRILDWAIF